MSRHHWHAQSHSPYCGSQPVRRGRCRQRSSIPRVSPLHRHQCTLPVATPVGGGGSAAALGAARGRTAAAASKRSAMRLKKCSDHERVSCKG